MTRMKILVLGLGNPLVGDDGVGLRVAARLKELLKDRPDVEVDEDYWGGLRLMERMAGYDRAIVIDAICTGAPPGTIHHLHPDSIPTQRSASAHDVNLPTALAFGRQHGIELPDDQNVLLVGIEAEDVLTFSESCTPNVEAAIPRAVEDVLQTLYQSEPKQEHPCTKSPSSKP
jgi:hydrogenase maturation protease